MLMRLDARAAINVANRANQSKSNMDVNQSIMRISWNQSVQVALVMCQEKRVLRLMICVLCN